MKLLFTTLLLGLFNSAKTQDTLYMKGAEPLVAKVTQIDEDDFISIQKTGGGKKMIDKLKKKDVKGIRFKNGYLDKFKPDPFFYAENIQLVNSKNIHCVVMYVIEDDKVIIDTDDSLEFISIPYDSVSSITSRTGYKEQIHELTKIQNESIKEIDSVQIVSSIDTAKAFKFIDKLNQYSINEELNNAKGDIEQIKSLFDKFVKDERHKGSISDSAITEIILEYCRLFEEPYFKGKKTGGLPDGEGILFKPSGEMQIGMFANGKLSGQGKVIRNSILEMEGVFIDGELNGEGFTIDSRGRIIKGIFVENQLTGQGSITLKSGAYEKGQFLEGKLNGDGERHLQNNNFYKGAFKSGKYGGNGVYHWANEDMTYEGDFEEGKRNGNGILKLPGGLIISGKWKNDCPEGELNIQLQTKNTDEPDTALWVIKDCEIESKKNIKGRIKLDKSLIFIKTKAW